MSDSLRLATVGGGALTVEACKDRWRIVPLSGIRLPAPAEWPREWLDSPQAWRLCLQLGHLTEIGTAIVSSEEISIPWSRFGGLEAEGFSLPFLWSDPSPFRISVHADPSDWKARFFLGGLEAAVERVGMFVRRAGHSGTFLLDRSAFELLALVDCGPRSGQHQWIDLGFLSAYAFDLCATVSGWLSDNEVIFPAAILSGRREGCLQRTLDVFIAELNREAFRRALAARAPGARRLPVFIPGEAWRHVIFDDEQLQALNGFPDRPGIPEAVSSVTGRVGTRQAAFLSRVESLPVRLRPEPPLISWHPHLSARRRPLRTVTRTHGESLAAADFAVRGYDTILLPHNCWTGASMIAASERDVFLVRVETRPCGEESLRATVRMAAEHRRLCDIPYRVALVSLQGCEPATRARAEEAGIQVLDRRSMRDASVITEEHIAAHESRRCRSVREAVEVLTQL